MGILFRPELIERIKAGVKTQTRRLPGKGVSALRPWRIVYAKRKLLQPAVEGDAYLRILRAGVHDLQDIIEADAIAEGFATRDEFARYWDQLHTEPGTRWGDNPAVVAVEFELVSREEAIGGGA